MSVFSGRSGEQAAANYLKRKGYRILDCNYRGRRGELDLIATRRGVLIFCEVKTRAPDSLSEPFEAVDMRKQEQIRRVAEEYLVRNQEYKCHLVRFDVLSLKTAEKKYEIMHIENAFS